MAARPDAKYSTKSEELYSNTSRAQTQRGHQTLTQTVLDSKRRHVNPTASPPTSNCQWAAWRSCFAWSAAQPAVKTNWLIMTWCRSSSIFTDMTAFYSMRSRRFQVENETNKVKMLLLTESCLALRPPSLLRSPSAATIIFLCHH